MDHSPASNWLTNIVGTGAIIGTVLGVLPAVAAGVAALWYFIQIWESATVQRWRAGRRIRKLARLKARVIMLEAKDRAAILPSSKLPDEGPALPN